MKRVLRPGGRLGLTAWADAEDDLARTLIEWWDGRAAEVLQAAMDERLPWRERFRRRLPLEEGDGGGHPPRPHRGAPLRFSTTLDDYVEDSHVGDRQVVRFMLGESAFASSSDGSAWSSANASPTR